MPTKYHMDVLALVRMSKTYNKESTFGSWSIHKKSLVKLNIFFPNCTALIGICKKNSNVVFCGKKNKIYKKLGTTNNMIIEKARFVTKIS